MMVDEKIDDKDIKIPLYFTNRYYSYFDDSILNESVKKNLKEWGKKYLENRDEE